MLELTRSIRVILCQKGVSRNVIHPEPVEKYLDDLKLNKSNAD
jgi:hypothetical protein